MNIQLTSLNLRSRRLAGILLIALMVTDSSVFAAGNVTWQGNTSANWNTAANWSAGSGGTAPPASGDSLIFGAAGTAGTTLNNDITGLTVNNWTNLSGAGAYIFSGNAVALSGILVNSSSSATETINLQITGTGSVSNNSGTLILGAPNTYSGFTTLTAGTLKLGTNNALGTGWFDVAGSSSSRTFDFNGFSLTNTWTNAVNQNGLTVANNGTGIATNTGDFSAPTISDFGFSGTGDIWWSGRINRSGGTSMNLTKSGANKVTMTGSVANNGVNNITVTGGTLVAGKTGSALMSDQVTVTGGTLMYDPTLTTSPANDWVGQVNSGVTITSGTFDLNGTSGNNNRMQWIVGSAGGMLTNSSSSPAALTLRERGSGPYANAQSIGGNLSLNFQLSTGSGATFNFTGNNSYNGTNTINTGAVAFSGNNTMTGLTVVSGGTLRLNSSTAIGSQTLTVSSGTIDNTSGANVTLANNNSQNWNGSFTFAGTTNLNLGGGAVAVSTSPTITANTNTLTVGGVVSGGANTLTKAGTGTLLLSGNNTWGTATLNAGVLSFAGISSTPTENLGKIVLGNNSGTIGSQMIFSNATVNITGANNTTVGGSGTSTNNTLWIQKSTWNGNGQRLELIAGVSNTCIIDGSVATNFTSLIGGNASAAFSSTLLVTNGGKLYVNATGLNELGRNTGANTNSIIITGAGSAWFNNSAGTATTGFTIGGTSGTTSNNVVQVNNGALWDHGGGTMRLNMFNLGSGLVINGGIVTNVYSLIIGNGANNNYVTVTNGGKFYGSASSGDFREIGRGNVANTSLLISDAGSIWNGGGATWTIGGTFSGTSPSSNTMTVANGGVFTNGSITVGGLGTGQSLVVSNGTVVANAITVNSGGSVYLNGGSGDALYADSLPGGSTLVVTGAAATASSVIVGWANGSSTVGPLLAGKIALNKSGSGTVLLTNANTYSGATTVGNGQLLGITGGSSSNSAWTATSGGTNGAQLATVNSSWSVGAFTNQSGAGFVLDANNLTLSTTVAPLRVLGSAVITNPVIYLKNLTGALAPGDYPLIVANAGGTGGTLGVYGTSTNIVAAVQSGYVSSLTTSGTTLSLRVSGIVSPVTFDSQGGSSVSSLNATYGSAYGTLPTPTRAGYTFNGWFTATSGGTQVTSGTTVAITSAQTLFAQWTINQYTLTYVAGANGSISGAATQTVDYGASGSAVTAVPNTGYHFQDWNDGVTNASRIDTANIGGTNVTANFVVNNYTVSFNSDGGSAVSSQSVTHNATATQPADPTKTGYNFAGWYADSGLLSSFSFSTAITNDTTLYAKWNVAVVTFDLISSSPTNGYQQGVFFTATNLPTDAGSNLVFAANGVPFSTNSLSNGGATSLVITNLPRGSTNIIVAIYNGDGTYPSASTNLIQVVTNHLPVVANVSYALNAGISSLRIVVSDLLTNASDLDGDALTLVSVTTSTNGILPTISGGLIGYYNTNGVNDSFSYTVTDGYGGTNTGTVFINVNNGPLFGTQLPQLSALGGGNVQVRFYGILGYNYAVQRSLDLISWTDISTNVANPTITVIDNPGTPSAYYRLKYRP